MRSTPHRLPITRRILLGLGTVQGRTLVDFIYTHIYMYIYLSGDTSKEVFNVEGHIQIVNEISD